MANHTRRPVFYPAGSCFGLVPEVGNNVHLVIGLERRLFPRFEPTFQDLRPGAEFDAIRAALNATLTAASMRAGLSVWWETVYSDALPAWEQANPKTPPEDENCIGFRIHLVGAMHEIGGFTEDLDELLDKARPAMLHRRRAAGPPMPGALVTATKEAIWKLGIFSQRGLQDLAKKEIVAVFLNEGTFNEWCQQPGNETSLLARLSIKTQAACEEHPSSPFGKCWRKQVLRPRNTGPLFDQEVWDRGFVVDLKRVHKSGTETPDKKTGVPPGYDWLLCSRPNSVAVLLPHIYPGKLDIQEVYRKQNLLDAQAVIPDIDPLKMAPALRIPKYHGPRPTNEAGDPNIGVLFQILAQDTVVCKQQQFTEREFGILKRVYPQQASIMCALRNGIDDLPERTLPALAGQVHKTRPLWDRAVENPQGIQPILATMQHEVGRIDDVGTNKLGIEWAEQPFHAVFISLLATYCKEMRQHSGTQLCTVLFSCLCQMTVTLASGHGTSIMTYGPPGSGKSDLQRTIELILGKLVKRQDFMSTAAQRSISLETDGMVVIEDEMKPRSEQERLMWQSRTGGDNFIVTTTVKQQMYDENGNPTRWENYEESFPMRVATQSTTNSPPSTLTAAERSRQKVILLASEGRLDVKAARRAAIKPEKLQQATDTIQDAFASAQRMAIWEGLLLGNSDWNMYVMRIFILYVKKYENGFLEEREWKRISDFAIGAQMMVLDHLLFRLPIDWGISDDEKTIIMACNRYPNPQALCMGWCLHNQLADTRVHFEDWAATVKELISAESNGLASQGAYFKMLNLKVSKENPVTRFNNAVEKTARENGFNPGKAYIETVFHEVTQGANPPLKNDDEGWWVSKEFARNHSSFSERKVLEAISEALEDRDLRENDRRPWPKVGPSHCNEALVRVDDLVDSIRASEGLLGPKQRVLNAMSEEDYDHARVLLEGSRGNEWIKVTNGVNFSRYLTQEEYDELKDNGIDSKAKCKKSQVYPASWVMMRTVAVENPILVAPSLLESVEARSEAEASPMAPAFLAACGPGYVGKDRLVGVHGSDADPIAAVIDPKNAYKVSLPNPSAKRKAPKAGGFAKRSAFTASEEETSIYGTTDEKLLLDSKSRLEQTAFQQLAKNLGMDDEAASLLSKEWTLEAMIRRAESQGVPVLADPESEEEAPEETVPPVVNPHAHAQPVHAQSLAGADGDNDDYGHFSDGALSAAAGDSSGEELPNVEPAPAAAPAADSEDERWAFAEKKNRKKLNRKSASPPASPSRAGPAVERPRARPKRQSVQSDSEDDSSDASETQRPPTPKAARTESAATEVETQQPPKTAPAERAAMEVEDSESDSESDSEDDPQEAPKPRRNPFIDEAAGVEGGGSDSEDEESDGDSDISGLINDEEPMDTDNGPMPYRPSDSE